MSGNTFDRSVRFYRSFIASNLPITPVDEIDEKQSEEFDSYYIAKYDDHGNLKEFRKYLHVEDNNSVQAELVFTDRYEYSRSGQLTSRELIHADGKESHWFFEVRDPDEIDGKVLLLAHNQLSEIEGEIISKSVTSKRSGSEFSFEAITNYLRSAERIMQQALNDPDLQLCPTTIDTDTEHGRLSLPPFDLDEMFLKSFLAEFQTRVLQREEFVCLPSVKLLFEKYPDGRRGFEELKIRAVAASPVRMSVDQKFLPIAILSVFGRFEWNDAVVEFVGSLLERVKLSLEGILEIGRRDDASAQKPQMNASDD